ncbi:unnamed protein product, partial [Didymodactylos carnosus]
MEKLDLDMKRSRQQCPIVGGLMYGILVDDLDKNPNVLVANVKESGNLTFPTEIFAHAGPLYSTAYMVPTRYKYTKFWRVKTPSASKNVYRENEADT